MAVLPLVTIYLMHHNVFFFSFPSLLFACSNVLCTRMVPQERNAAPGVRVHAQQKPRLPHLLSAGEAGPGLEPPVQDPVRRRLCAPLPPLRVRPDGPPPRPQGEQHHARHQLQCPAWGFRPGPCHRQREDILRRARRRPRYHRVHRP